jgi:hypothetical protein
MSSQAYPVAAVEPHPVRVVVTDDLRRSRLTVAFRLVLAVPHIVFLVVWGIAANLATVANWFATLVRGSSPESLHAFLARYDRYLTHVGAYLGIVSDPFPAFSGRPGYPPISRSTRLPSRDGWASRSGSCSRSPRS